MSRIRLLSVVALGLGLALGACDVEEVDPLETRIASVHSESEAQAFPTRYGGDFDLPGDDCAHLEHGSGDWCDCMGAAIDDMTHIYNECEDILAGEGPIDVTLYMWCASLEDDFDDWWDNC